MLIFIITDVLALAASIGELSSLTRRARTANWSALQMADKNNPDFHKLGLELKPVSDEDCSGLQSFTLLSQASKESSDESSTNKTATNDNMETSGGQTKVEKKE